MKTKIIYISGNEIFDMRDIRAAFDEVRCALNLDKDTLLFGVPVDADDAGIMNKTTNKTIEPVQEITTPVVEEIIPETPEIKDIQEPKVIEESVEEIVTPKKRGRPRKEIESVETNEIIKEKTESIDDEKNDDVIVDADASTTIPILSVLSVNENESEKEEDSVEPVDVITEITEEKTEDTDIVETIEEVEEPIDTTEDEEPDLEKLLSAMTPLAEDTMDEKTPEPIVEEEDISVDATLEQLATEFAENQDKIASESKSNSRSKIGKLRNILPFKQSKHKDQGIGDLLEWAGIAANDEDFSVPGFFTNVASKK